jgi:hypothetical protein
LRIEQKERAQSESQKHYLAKLFRLFDATMKHNFPLSDVPLCHHIFEAILRPPPMPLDDALTKKEIFLSWCEFAR